MISRKKILRTDSVNGFGFGNDKIRKSCNPMIRRRFKQARIQIFRIMVSTMNNSRAIPQHGILIISGKEIKIVVIGCRIPYCIGIRKNPVDMNLVIISCHGNKPSQSIIVDITVFLYNPFRNRKINTKDLTALTLQITGRKHISIIRKIRYRVQLQVRNLELDRIHPKGGESRGVAPLVVARKGERAAEFIVGCVAVALAEDFHARKFVSPHGFVQALRDVTGILDFYLVKNIFIA